MSEQLDLICGAGMGGNRMAVFLAFDFLWRYGLKDKPSAVTWMGNRKAVVKSFGHKWLDEVTFLDVEAHKRRRSHLKAAVYHDHGLISNLFNTMAAWKRRRIKLDGFDFSTLAMPPENPTTGIRKRRPPPRRVTVSPDEFSRLLEHAITDRIRDTIVCVFFLGMNETDLVRFAPDWLNRSNGRVEWVRNKTGKFVSIPPSRSVLRRIQAAAKAGRPLVCDLTNHRKEFELTRERARLPHVHLFRDLRKTIINGAINDRGSIEDGQYLAGHSSPRTTVDYYRVVDGWDFGPVIRNIEKKYFPKKLDNKIRVR